MALTQREAFARVMEHLCTHSAHGYSQSTRWGNGQKESVDLGDGVVVEIAGGDRDCSSAIISALDVVGIYTDATYTGNMKSALLATGLFTWQNMSFTAQRGDIYLNHANHTAMCTNPCPDELAEFSISENGGIYGEEGNQTGCESHITGYYDYPWDGILHWQTDGDTLGGSSSSSGSSGATTTDGVRYRARVGGVWLSEMVNTYDTGGSGDDYAGIIGQPIEFLAVDTGLYQVRTQDSGLGYLLVPSIYNYMDLDLGCAGDGSPIYELRIGDDGIAYQVHTQESGWLDVMHGLNDTGGSADDFAGIYGQAIDGVRIWRR